MNVVTKAYSLKVASVAEDAGTFSGVAVPYDIADERGDTIRAGAFKKSIADAQGVFPCLWSHQPTEVLGTITVEADNRNLAVSGALLLHVVPKAKEVHGLMLARAVRGLSIGFVPLRWEPRSDGGMDYTEGRLCEVSLCATPSYVGAQVHQVRSLSTSNVEAEVLKALGVFDASKWKTARRWR